MINTESMIINALGEESARIDALDDFAAATSSEFSVHMEAYEKGYIDAIADFKFILRRNNNGQ